MLHTIHLDDPTHFPCAVESVTGLQVSIDAMEPHRLHEVASLSRRARRFKASAQWYPESELREFLVRPDHHVLEVRIATPSPGRSLIGCLLCHAYEEDFIADDFILDDEFMGYRIEYAMVKSLSQLAFSYGCGAVVLRLARSEDNLAARAFYESLGIGLEILPSGSLEVAFASFATDDILAKSERRTHSEASPGPGASLLG